MTVPPAGKFSTQVIKTGITEIEVSSFKQSNLSFCAPTISDTPNIGLIPPHRSFLLHSTTDIAQRKENSDSLYSAIAAHSLKVVPSSSSRTGRKPKGFFSRNSGVFHSEAKVKDLSCSSSTPARAATERTRRTRELPVKATSDEEDKANVSGRSKTGSNLDNERTRETGELRGHFGYNY